MEAAPASAAEPGTKHKTDHAGSPDAKRAKGSNETRQKTIEETLNKETTLDHDKESTPEKKENNTGSPNSEGNKSNDEAEKKQDTKEKQPDVSASNKNGTAEQPGGREGAVPSNILEKGIIYFFFRGRVGIQDPDSVDEVARSYFILRPLDKDAKLGEGPIGDAGNTRLLALPKKVLPASGRDRFLIFVEKANASFQTLRDDFLAASDYATKTLGMRHSPAATPIGEGVYAIITTGRDSHLAYMLTLPDELGDVQKEMGLRDKGSFALSTKNPTVSGPANAQLPQGAEYPEEIQEKFRSLRWMPTQPKHLDYANAQVLLVGESGGLEKALQSGTKDSEDGNANALEELEKLEEEDTARTQDLGADDSAAIFADLEAQAKDLAKLKTTF